MNSYKSILVLALTASLIACGGGGSDEPPTAAFAKLADCFQVGTQNAYRMSVVHSPSGYQSGGGTGLSVTGVNPQIDPSTALPLTPPVVNTSHFYVDSIYDTSYRLANYRGVAATVKNRVGHVFVAGTSNASPVAFDNDYYLPISPSNFSYLGSSVLGTAGAVVSEFEDASLNLSIAVGEKTVSTNTFSFTVNGQLTDGATTKTITYVAQEDLATQVGVFKNSCKLDVEVQTVATSAQNPLPKTVRSSLWVAPGWGVVKELSIQSFSDGRSPSVAARNRQVTAVLRGSL